MNLVSVVSSICNVYFLVSVVSSWPVSVVSSLSHVFIHPAVIPAVRSGDLVVSLILSPEKVSLKHCIIKVLTQFQEQSVLLY